MKSIAIVILNHNGKQYLEKFLPKVIQHSPDCDIVVADNFSGDDSLDYLQQTFPEIMVMKFDRNYGFCGGYNKALFQLNYDIFVLLNSDIEVTEGWMKPIKQMFDGDDTIAAIQPKLLDYNLKTKFEYAGGAGGYLDKFGYPFCRGRIFDSIETDEGQYNDSREIFWASGAALCIRGDLFKSYQGFDNDFFAHMEEIDLCWRMKKDGRKIMFCADSVIYHVGGGTLSYSNPTKTYLNFRNSLVVLIKNLPSSELVWKVIIRVLLDYVAALKFAFTGQIRDAMMVIKAHFYILSNLKRNLNKRTNNKSSHTRVTEIYPKSLLFSYHIARVRKFSNLGF